MTIYGIDYTGKMLEVIAARERHKYIVIKENSVVVEEKAINVGKNVAEYSMWIEGIKSFVKSDESQEALSLMDDKSQNFLLSFANGMMPINDQNSAKCLLELLDNLSGGYEKVEITSDDLSGCINRPMTIEEATGALEMFINKKCYGKDKKKVRIVLSK